MIRNSLSQMDDLVIDSLCQPVVDWIRGMREISCFAIGRACIDVSAVFWILSQADAAAAASRTGIPGIMMLQYTLIVLMLGALVTLRQLLERADGAAGGNRCAQANPMRLSMAKPRLLLLLGLGCVLIKTVFEPIDFESAANLVICGFATTGFYAGACSNRPPMRHRYTESSFDIGHAKLPTV